MLLNYKLMFIMPANLLIQMTRLIIIYSLTLTVVVILATTYLYPTKKLI
jgi:hypothetical protein